MASIKINAVPLTTKDEKLQIRFTINIGKERKPKYIATIPGTKIKTNGKISWKHWDPKSLRVKNYDLADEINDRINTIEASFNELEKQHKAKGTNPTMQEILCLFGSSTKSVQPSENSQAVNSTTCEETIEEAPIYKDEKGEHISYLMHVYDIFKKEKAGDIKTNSMKPYKTFRDQLQAFEAIRENKVLNLEEVSQKTYKEFANFLIKKQNNVNSTINRKITRFKTFMIWAQEEGYVKQGTFRKKFRLDELEANKFPLYEEEIEAFKSFMPGTPIESEVYWAFLFALETGLRYSDILQLAPVHIFEADFEGQKVKYIDIAEHKTSERSTVPLSNEALRILNRFSFRKDKFFKIPTDQEVNRTLKDIAEDVKLERLCNVQQLQGKELVSEILPLKEILSFHFARYTYITQALNNGLNPLFVQNNVGHNKLDTTLEYNRTIDKSRFLETLAYLNNKRKTA